MRTKVLSFLLIVMMMLSAVVFTGCGKKESADDPYRAMAVQELIKKADFKMTRNDGSFKTYTAVLENTTSYDFSYFTLHINLNDKGGVTVETQNVSADNWTAGSKHRFKFKTDKKFEKIVVTSCSYNCD